MYLDLQFATLATVAVVIENVARVRNELCEWLAWEPGASRGETSNLSWWEWNEKKQDVNRKVGN